MEEKDNGEEETLGVKHRVRGCRVFQIVRLSKRRDMI